MQAYKVAQKINEDTFGSATLSTANKYFLQYRIGERAVPKIGGIFAFETLGDALNFTSISSKETILVCEAEVDKDLTWITRICFTPAQHNISAFWKRQGPDLIDIPEGTVLCKSLTPLRVWNEEDKCKSIK